MSFFKPQSEFPTPLFKVSLAFLFGMVLGGGLVWWRLYPLIGATKDVDVNLKRAQTAPTTTTAADPTANWTKFSSTGGKFNFKYNPDWKKLTCDDDSTVYLAPTTAALAVCNSDSGSQITIYSQAGDHRSDQRLTAADGYTSITSENVTVSSVTGTRMRGVLTTPGPVGSPANTITVIYSFYTNGRTYTASYNQEPSGARSQNVLSDFDLLVKNTFKFTS